MKIMYISRWTFNVGQDTLGWLCTPGGLSDYISKGLNPIYTWIYDRALVTGSLTDVNNNGKEVFACVQDSKTNLLTL